MRTYRVFPKSVGIIYFYSCIKDFFAKCRDYFAPTSTFRFFQQSVGTFFIFPATNQEKKSYIRIESATLSRKKLYIRSKGNIFKENPDTFGIFTEYTYIGVLD